MQFQGTCGEGIAAVVKDLPQRRGAVGSPGLLPVDGIQRLVEEEAQRTQHEGPRWSLDVRGGKEKKQMKQMELLTCDSDTCRFSCYPGGF